jgi:hypothetical protein
MGTCLTTRTLLPLPPDVVSRLLTHCVPSPCIPQACFMYIGGRLEQKWGARWVTLLGCCLVCTATFLASASTIPGPPFPTHLTRPHNLLE